MKSIFSQISKSSLSNHAKRLTMAVVFLSFAAIATAGWSGTATVTATAPTGLGVVYVDGGTSSGNGTTSATTTKSISNKDPKLTFTIEAKPAPRYCFTTWTTNTSNGTLTDVTSTANPAQGSIEGHNGILGGWAEHDPSVSYTANFARIISISDIKTEKILAWLEDASLNTSRAKIIVPVQAAQDGDIMTIDIIESGDDYLQSTDVKLYNADNTDITSQPQITRSTDGNFVFYVGYQGTITDLSVLIQKKIRLKVVAKGDPDDRDWEEFDVIIAEAPKLKFKGTNGKGTYSSNLLSSFDTYSSETYPVAITNPSMLRGVNLSLSTDPDDGEIFLGWKVTKLDGTETLISYAESCTAPEFEGGETIEAVFVPNTCGYIIMNGKAGNMSASNNNVYVDLHSALVDAETIKNTTNKAQFVVLENLSTIFTNKGVTRTKEEQPNAATSATLPNREGGYTIPADITLLIPADKVYNYCLGEISKDYYSSGLLLTQYRKLVVEKGTQITVNGNICVFGLLNYNTAAVGSCGVIELQEGSHIDVNGGLYVFGYIINPQGTKVTDENMHLVGKITANSGAEVREVLQMTDWRGGQATSGMISAKNVFPINQYYAQNIEAPITLKEGCREILTTAVNVTLMGTLVAHPKFILPLDDGEEGFFLMGPATSLTKYYDWENDRLKFIVKGEPTTDVPNPIAKISSMNISLGSYNVVSANFVLPVTNNIDIRVTNITVNLPNPMCILAGGTLTVDDNAKVFVNGTSNKVASCYVYDNEWNTQDGTGTGAGYFGQSNVSVALLSRRPGAFNTPRRTIKDDASLIINGLVEIGQHGALYTTAEGSEGYTYGANITSTGSGRIKFVNIGDGTKTQQVIQNNTSTATFDIPVSSARLKNSDGTFVHTNSNESEGESYVYIDGFWQIPTWVLPTINITLPTQVFTGTLDYPITDYDKNDNWEATLSGNGFTFDGTKTTITLKHNDEMGNNITLPIHYTAQNEHGYHEAMITLTNATKNETYSTLITATEEYTPIFNVTPTDIPLGETYINTPISVGVPTLQITPQSNENVTSLHNDDTYYSRLKWEAISIKNSSDNSDNTDFTFTPGEGKNALSGAKITFNSATPGTQSVKITLRATYTDASSPSQQINSEDVIINVTATAKALEANNFTLTDECEQELKNMCVGIPVALEFKDLTLNTKPLDFQFANNGAVGSEVLTLSGEGTDEEPYTIIANSVPAVMPTITISQESDGIYVAHTTTTYATQISNCTPEVQWHWSDMYFGKTYNNPITTNSTGAYTLTLKSVTKNATAVTVSDVITYNAENTTATVKSNLSGEYIATFEFEQEAGDAHIAYSQTFTANIYQDPSVLPLCVESERIFTAVTSTSTGEVKYNINQIDFSENATWTMTFIGIPDVLSFTPTANTQLTIEQREEGGSFGTVFYQTVEAGTNYQVELAPATKYVKFTVVDPTSFSSLCLTELDRVRITPNILYMPISNDPANAPTTRTITVTYASARDIEFHSSDAKITIDPLKLSKTAEGEFKVVNVMVSSAATSEYNTSLYVQHAVGGKAEVDIETYRFPQKLPIQLERGKDEAKRFHFITIAYKNTEWDAAQYAIKMQNKTTAEDNRPYVTFVFDGAPSFLSFVPVVATTAEDWLIEEGVDATSLHPVAGEVTIENGELKQTLDYNSSYVRVTYVGTSAEVVQMTQVNILSDQGVIPNPEELTLTEANKYSEDVTVGEDLSLTTVNLTNLSVNVDNPHFSVSYGTKVPLTELTLDADDIADVFGEDVVGVIPFKVFWNASQATEFGNITFTTEVDGAMKTLATVPLMGSITSIGKDDVLYTGVKDGYTLKGTFDGVYDIAGNDGIEYRPIDLSCTYDANNKPLFDYLIIYGETTTTDGTTTITTPTTTQGSNAKTPIYIYVSDGEKYNFAQMEENANSANKMVSVMPVTKDNPLRVYITGFCPYATTGYTKEDEGVWYFQGENGAHLDIYLNDCYIYSRNKTVEGRSFSGRYDGQAFSEGYVRGSGGVLVFENQTNSQSGSFNVTIHTRSNNMLKSNYGCFFELMQGMRAYNVSSPVQVRLASTDHKANSKTILTFDDKWPNDVTNYELHDRTNGRLSLQKQVNNAPSIDLGNANTIVNFNGGQVELQNAAVVSPNYKTTLAISFRSGMMAGFPMAYGIGTDDVGGKVYFLDGTTTVIPMYVDSKFKDYYLLDTDAEGKYITTGSGENTKYLTSCLRCPTSTFVYGGSHCMMRACEDVTSKGGAPSDENGVALGIYKYPKTKTGDARGGFGDKNEVGLVTPTDVPEGYKVESVTPNTNGTDDISDDDYLNFWFTQDEESSVKPEVDKIINFWKTCMTEISATYMSYGGTVGGPTKILAIEENQNLLYCQIDENISNVITAGTGTGDDKVYTYTAPVKDPSGQLSTPYLSIPPSYVGSEWQNYIETVERTGDGDVETGDDYAITNKVYYVVPTTADTWLTFTAPFNVEKLWIVETYDEAKLADTPLKSDEDGNRLNKRTSVLLEQAKHNADFAAFFGVAMALGRDQSFDEIYNDYIGWAKHTDKHSSGTYTKRGRIELEHYNGKNFATAHYYLYHNEGEWKRNDNNKFDTQWKVVGEVGEGEILMRQGETYSMLFPYCTGCDVQKDADGNIIKDVNGLPILSATRDYWDYWSGKFLIFESTQATAENPHKIKGSNYHSILFEPAKTGDGNSAILTGNSTFAQMTSSAEVDNKVFTYSPIMSRENFDNNSYSDENGDMMYQQIEPTVSFLIADIPSPAGIVARRVLRTGEIIYERENSSSDSQQGGIPTVGGGNDLFITSTEEGINIAVAEPQQVRVVSSTGWVIFSGMVSQSVDVPLSTTGIYIVSGENEVHKIVY